MVVQVHAEGGQEHCTDENSTMLSTETRFSFPTADAQRIRQGRWCLFASYAFAAWAWRAWEVSEEESEQLDQDACYMLIILNQGVVEM